MSGKKVSNKEIETFICDECSEEFDIDKLTNNDVEGLICQECIDEFYKTCYDCGRCLHKDDSDLHYSENQQVNYCNDCYNSTFTICSDCSREMWNDDANWNNDYPYCDNCYNPEDDESDRWRCSFEFRRSKTFNENKSKRMVGIEIEAVNGESSIVDDECGDFVSCVYDGSISDGDEFVSNPANGDLLYRDIKKLTQSLRDGGYVVDSRCGLHCHFDIRDISENDKKKLHIAYSLFEKFFFEMVSPSRRDNQYCHTLRKDYEVLFAKKYKNYLTNREDYVLENEIICSRYDSRRYDWVNLNSSYVRGSLEIRNHNGTIDSVKIINWIRIHNRFIDWVLKTDIKRLVNLKPLLRTFYHIIDNDGENIDLIKYIQHRRRKFNKKISRKKIKNVKHRLDENYPLDSMERFYREPPFILPYVRDIIEEFRKEYDERTYRREKGQLINRMSGRLFDARNYGYSNFREMMWFRLSRFERYLCRLPIQYLKDNKYDGIIMRELLTDYGDLTSKGREVFAKRYIRRFNKNVRDTIYKTIRKEFN